VQPHAQPIEEPQVISRREREDAIGRILGSETFRRAAKLREFLRYIADHTLSNDVDAIREQQIGVAVFGRDPAYNAADDSVVRVQARQLREKLREYYATEGAGGHVVVSVPKGRYVPVFELRPKAETAALSPAGTLPSSRSLSGWRVGLLCLIVFAAGVGFRSLLWPSRQSAPPAAHVPGSGMNPVLAAVFQPGKETMVVMEDMGLYTAYALRDRDEIFKLDDYRNNRHLPDIPSRFSDSASAHRLAGVLRGARFVAYANASFAFKLAAAYPESSRGVTVRFPRDIHLRDVQANNLVLLGGTTVNPWVGLYEDGLNFTLEYLQPAAGFTNRAPLGNEPAVFGDSGTGPRSYFARIAVIPNLQLGSRVLILTGQGTAATEAAGDFVLNPHSAESLPVEVVQALRQPGAAVEILLKCVPLLEAPYRSEVAAWRVRAK
jgi:hypothetical protein